MEIIEQIVRNLYEFKEEKDLGIKENLLYILQSDIKYLGKISGLQENVDKTKEEKTKLVIANLLQANKELKEKLLSESENSYLVIENTLKCLQKDLRLFNMFYVRHANIRKNLVVEIELIPSIDVESLEVTTDTLNIYKEDDDFTYIIASDENINKIISEINNLYGFVNLKEISLNYVDNIKVLKNIKLDIPLSNICDYYDKVVD